MLPRLAVPPRPVVVLGRVVRPRPVVDFAIIREYGETMVGPEDARTGWNPAGTIVYLKAGSRPLAVGLAALVERSGGRPLP